MKTLVATSFALVAFAANSVLCRLALGGGRIDAASFTAIRLLAGILALKAILRVSRGGGAGRAGSVKAAAMLAAYAVCFSFAYLTLDTATGALILFASVQLSMVFTALAKGERQSAVEWVGVLLAVGGFVYLVMPDLNTPSLAGFILMAVAGAAWGAYTLLGRGSSSPLADTAANFTRTWPVIIALGLFALPEGGFTIEGVWLAALSGAVASGIGYAVWYLALPGLGTTQAAVVQLIVPVLAALGGVAVVGEALSPRLVLSAGLILGGIVLVVFGKKR